MERSGAADSQGSECSGVLDLSCTYKLSSSLPQPDPTARTFQEDSSLASSFNNTGSRKNDCEDNEKIRLEDDERLSALSPSSSFSIFGEQRSSTITSSPKLEASEDEDAQIRANLDAFYELSSLPAADPFSHHLTEKILELKQKNHLYALRSFQMGKIILHQEGAKVLQSCTSDNVFSSTGGITNVNPVPGLSDDVVNYLKEKTSTKERP